MAFLFIELLVQNVQKVQNVSNYFIFRCLKDFIVRGSSQKSVTGSFSHLVASFKGCYGDFSI